MSIVGFWKNTIQTLIRSKNKNRIHYSTRGKNKMNDIRNLEIAANEENENERVYTKHMFEFWSERINKIVVLDDPAHAKELQTIADFLEDIGEALDTRDGIVVNDGDIKSCDLKQIY